MISEILVNTNGTKPYLNQCQLNYHRWDHLVGTVYLDNQDINLHVFFIYIFEITSIFPRGQWANTSHFKLAPDWLYLPVHSCKSWWHHQMETFQGHWPFVRGIHRSPMDSPHKGQWRRASIFFICAWTNSWANNRDAVIWDAIALIMTSL